MRGAAGTVKCGCVTTRQKEELVTDEFREKVFEAIRKEIGADPSTVDPDKPLREQVMVDSMQFISLIARLETVFDKDISVSAMQVETLNEFLRFIEGEVGTG
jgi:acyl carrier protein